MVNKKRGRILILIVGILIAFSFVLFYFLNATQTKQEKKEEEKQVRYAWELPVKQALEKLELQEKAETIGAVQTLEKVIAITLEGLAEEEVMREIASLFEGKEPTFFIPGIKAAEDEEAVRRLTEKGFPVENYTLDAQKGMQAYTQEELAENFVRTNVILETITGTAPNLLKANGSIYEENILKAAKAASLEKVVESDSYLSYQSISSQQEALYFVQNLQRGSVVSIKLNGVLDEKEYKKEEQIEEVNEEEEPAKDKMPSLNIKDPEKADPKEQRLLQGIQFLLEALEKEGYQIVPLEQLERYSS